MMPLGTKGKLDQAMVMLEQIEYDEQGQTGKILRFLSTQKQPLRPVDIAKGTDLLQPSVRRNLQTLVKSEQVKKHPLNKYSMIK